MLYFKINVSLKFIQISSCALIQCVKDENDVTRKMKERERGEKRKQKTGRMEDKWAKRGDDVREERKLQAVRGCIFRERMERLAVDFEKCTLPPDPISLSLSLFIPRVATCCDPVPLGDLRAMIPVLNSCVNSPFSPLLIIIALAAESLIEEK